MAYAKKTDYCEICRTTVKNLWIHLKYTHKYPPKLIRKYFETEL